MVLKADLQKAIQTFVAEQGARLRRALDWTKRELTEEGDEERTQWQKRVWAYLKIRREGFPGREGKYPGLITGKQIRGCLQKHEEVFSEKSPVQAIEEMEASQREKGEALFVVTLYGFDQRMSKVRGRPDAKKETEALFDEVVHAILAFAVTEQDLAWKLAEEADPLVGLTAVEQTVGDSYRDLQKACRIVEPGVAPADLQLAAGEARTLIPKRVKEKLDEIRRAGTALSAKAGLSVSERTAGVITFQPMGFEKGYRGYVGQDCTTCVSAQAFAALHPANRYYAIRKEGRDYGYVGLTETALVGAADQKVLVVDTIQSPASVVPTKHIPEILDRLEEIARQRGFAHLALPEDLTPTFNHEQVREAIRSRPRYQASKSSGSVVFLAALAGEVGKTLSPHFGVSDASESLAEGSFYLWADAETAKAEAEKARRDDPLGRALIRTPEYWIEWAEVEGQQPWQEEGAWGALSFAMERVFSRLKRWSGGELSAEQEQAVWGVFQEAFRHFSGKQLEAVVRELDSLQGEDFIVDVSQHKLPGILSSPLLPAEVMSRFVSALLDPHDRFVVPENIRECVQLIETLANAAPDSQKKEVRAFLAKQLEIRLAPSILRLWEEKRDDVFRDIENFSDLLVGISERWLEQPIPPATISREKLERFLIEHIKIAHGKGGRDAEDDWLDEMWGVIVQEIGWAYSKRPGVTVGLEEDKSPEDRLVQYQEEIAARGIAGMAPSEIGSMSRWLQEAAVSADPDLAIRAQHLRLTNRDALSRSVWEEGRISGTWTPSEGPAPIVFSFEHADTLPWAPLVAQAGALVAVMAQSSPEAEELRALFEGFQIPEGRFIVVPMDVAIDRDTAVEMIHQHFQRAGLPVIELIPLPSNTPHERIEEILREFGLRFDSAPIPRLIVVERYLSALA